MNGGNGPLSPISLGDDEWMSMSKYQTFETESVYQYNRGQLASPPMSSGSGTMNGGFRYRESPKFNVNSGPSPPSSIARSSLGTGINAQTESGMIKKEEQFEGVLSDHYLALERYLSASLNDEKGNPRPNRARDKLLRLSPVQFLELSTDVYDELLRRQQNGKRARNAGNLPPYLLPKDTFHPKRNQARQKLSTLPSPRFRDLATDVFYELERRLPKIATDINRAGSPAISVRGMPSRMNTPVNGNDFRRPSDASSIAQSMNESRIGFRSPTEIPPSPGIRNSEIRRPTPKTFLSNTIIPIKSTMVEDDETGGEDAEEEDGDAFGLENAARMTGDAEEASKKRSEDTQLKKSKNLLDALELKLKEKDDEISNLLQRETARDNEIDAFKQDFESLKLELESKLADAQNLNESLQSELDRVKASHATTERNLQEQVKELQLSELRAKKMETSIDLERENSELKKEIGEQQLIAEQVSMQAQDFLREMRTLSNRSESLYKREDQLLKTIGTLEEEVKIWKNRYAKTKAQLKTSKVSSIGLNVLQDAAKEANSKFLESDGMVRDINVTKFQISIDELLNVARSEQPTRVMECMKTIVFSVRDIIQDVADSSDSNEELPANLTRLKVNISGTAKNLITASKNFAGANGFSPVSLVDAAASNLTSAVVEFLRVVKIRSTHVNNYEDSEDEVVTTTKTAPIAAPTDIGGLYPMRELEVGTPSSSNQAPSNARISGNSSIYSPFASPRELISQESSPRQPISPSNESWSGQVQSLSRIASTNFDPMSPPPLKVNLGIPSKESEIEEFKIYLEDQTALLVQNIQSLVTAIRSESGITATGNSINTISEVVGAVVSHAESKIFATGNSELRTRGEQIIKKLAASQKRLIESGEIGRQIAEEGRDDDEGERAWRVWNQSLPPIAFEIAREVKDLVLQVDRVDLALNDASNDEDFS
ncbi:Bgt-4971 [Blumeria graminis f. sp. tritici]|uniref:Bgt-4971 n=2 Tax=Blumeria graminis f. sp. tritici TaxID=62690 RepID=A0A381LGA4_BLUGR|nr:Component of the polarisome [Blumeria graminis f. sp. tritici 96224]VDB93251.1 Bgt-4971 [Blumeria graminis f. sp. tritici]